MIDKLAKKWLNAAGYDPADRLAGRERCIMLMHLNEGQRAHFSLGDKTQALTNPTEEELRKHFPPHVVERILRMLDTETGDLARDFEVRCTRVANVLWTPFDIHVTYATQRRDPKTNQLSEGIQFAIFRFFTEQMRALLVTHDGYVVMQNEYRRLPGAWKLMHCAGGTKKHGDLKTILTEVFSETGCNQTTGPDGSNIFELRRSPTDDGVQGDPLIYIAMDRMRPRGDDWVNPDDSIRGIVRIPFEEWRERALDGEYEDPFSENFAARCSYDRERQRLIVRGKHTKLISGPGLSL